MLMKNKTCTQCLFSKLSAADHSSRFPNFGFCRRRIFGDRLAIPLIAPESRASHAQMRDICASHVNKMGASAEVKIVTK